MKKRSKRRLIRYSLLAANAVLLFAVLGFVLKNPTASEAVKPASLSISSNNQSESPLDQLSSADIATHIAHMTHLEETTSVSNKADTVSAQLAISPADDKVVAKPQVVTTALKSRKDIQTYVTQNGDTISSLAAKFGVTSDSIRWSNGLTGNTVAAGKEVVISPISSGVVYTVKAGDTPDKLAERFRTNKDQIIAFNDAEVAGLPVGEKIVIPDGTQPAPVARNTGIYSGAGFAWGGFSAVYSGNGYDYGYCTWWAAVRRAQIGRPVPSNLGNASSWKVLAQRAGFGVGNAPAAGAVIWTPPHDYYGHVGFVESVDADGTAHISEMNVAGWGRVSSRTLSPAQASAYSYIY